MAESITAIAINGVSFTHAQAGTAGEDTNFGDTGNSLYLGSPGRDIFFNDVGWFAAGMDVVDYSDSPEAVIIDQRFGMGWGGHAEGDRYEASKGSSVRLSPTVSTASRSGTAPSSTTK